MIREIEIRATKATSNTITLSGEAWARTTTSQWATLFKDGKIITRQADPEEKIKVNNIVITSKVPVKQPDGSTKMVLCYKFKFEDDEAIEKKMDKSAQERNKSFRGLYEFITQYSHQCSYKVRGQEMNPNVTQSSMRFDVHDLTESSAVEKALWYKRTESLNIVKDLFESDEQSFNDVAYLLELKPHSYNFKDALYNDVCNMVFNAPEHFLNLYKNDTNKEIEVLIRKALTVPVDGANLINEENGVMFLLGEGIGTTIEEAIFNLKRNTQQIEYLKSKLGSTRKPVASRPIVEQKTQAIEPQDDEDMVKVIKKEINEALSSKHPWDKRKMNMKREVYATGQYSTQWNIAIEELKAEGKVISDEYLVNTQEAAAAV